MGMPVGSVQFGSVPDDPHLFAHDRIQQIRLLLHRIPKLLIDQDAAVLCHRPDGELRLGWVGEFSKEDHVHRNLQGLGHHFRHYHATSGKA